MSYTALVVLALVSAGILDLFILRTRLLLRRAFWTAYAIVISFQLITNSWLTGPWRLGGIRNGMPIVNYDESAITGLRIAHAPVEDLGFGFALILTTLSFWVFWGRRGVERERYLRP